MERTMTKLKLTPDNIDILLNCDCWKFEYRQRSKIVDFLRKIIRGLL